MGLFTRKTRSNADDDYKKWEEDLDRRVVTERTLSWEAHKARILGTLLVVKERQKEDAEKGIVDQEYDAVVNGLQTEAGTFAQREQEMRLQGEIR